MGSKLLSFYTVFALDHSLDVSGESRIIDAATVFQVRNKVAIRQTVDTVHETGLAWHWDIPSTWLSSVPQWENPRRKQPRSATGVNASTHSELAGSNSLYTKVTG